MRVGTKVGLSALIREGHSNISRGRDGFFKSDNTRVGIRTKAYASTNHKPRGIEEGKVLKAIVVCFRRDARLGIVDDRAVETLAAHTRRRENVASDIDPRNHLIGRGKIGFIEAWVNNCVEEREVETLQSDQIFTRGVNEWL